MQGNKTYDMSNLKFLTKFVCFEIVAPIQSHEFGELSCLSFPPKRTLEAIIIHQNHNVRE